MSWCNIKIGRREMGNYTRANAKPERNADIVDMRLNRGIYYRIIAEKHGISTERVRQIVEKHLRYQRWREYHNDLWGKAHA